MIEASGPPRRTFQVEIRFRFVALADAGIPAARNQE